MRTRDLLLLTVLVLPGCFKALIQRGFDVRVELQTGYDAPGHDDQLVFLALGVEGHASGALAVVLPDDWPERVRSPSPLGGEQLSPLLELTLVDGEDVPEVHPQHVSVVDYVGDQEPRLIPLDESHLLRRADHFAGPDDQSIYGYQLVSEGRQRRFRIFGLAGKRLRWIHLADVDFTLQEESGFGRGLYESAAVAAEILDGLTMLFLYFGIWFV